MAVLVQSHGACVLREAGRSFVAHGPAHDCVSTPQCDAECRKKYHFNSHRKSTVLRVRKYLNDLLLDQLPVLTDVQRYMDELTVMEAPAPTAMARGIVLEVEPEIREALERSANWDEVIAFQMRTIPKVADDTDVTK